MGGTRSQPLVAWIIHEIRFVFERGGEDEAVYPHTANLIVYLIVYAVNNLLFVRFLKGNA